MNEGLNQQWKEAVLNKRMDKLVELCRIETMSERVRRWTEPIGVLNLSNYNILNLCIKLHVPAYRIKYLVEKCGQTPNSSTLELAISEWHWTAVDYLHEELGIKHVDKKWVYRHLDHLIIKQWEGRTMEFTLDYLPFLNNSEDDMFVWLHDVARFRKKQAFNASVVILGLKRRKNPLVYSQDVLRLISNIVMKKENVAKKEWGYPMFFQRKDLGISISNHSKDVFKVWVKIAVVYLVCVLLFYIFFMK